MLAEELRIADCIRFPGYVSQERSRVFYNIADIFVLPSITLPTGKEPWGLVVNEAMNQGVPVIATEAVGAAAGGLVQDGINGCVVKERNSNQLAASMLRLLMDQPLRIRLGEAAREEVSKWDYERNVSGYKEAISYVMAKDG